MPLILLAFVLFLPLIVVVLIPLSLIQRYRTGTARRIARGWLATLNVAGLALSSLFFLMAAAATSPWVPGAFLSAVAGWGAGCALGVVGLWLTRWEASPRGLHYTPNRWLVLAITLVVTTRLFYGFWRAWHAWLAPPADTSWLAASGAAGSFAAGAVVLGYYLTYWFGVRRRISSRR